MDTPITLLTYKENYFTFDNDTFQPGSAVSVSMGPYMTEIEQNQDMIGLQLALEYSFNGKPVIKYSGQTLFLAEGWQKYKENPEDLNRFKILIWTQAFGFFRGILCEKVRGTDLERFYLPQMPSEEIAKVSIGSAE